VSSSGQAGQLVLQDVTKRFGGVEAVSHVSFSVREGEVLGLIGPNGAGKSTLLSLVSGGQRPNAGQIVFRGQRLDRLAAHVIARSGVGRAHQIPRPFGRMTILDNVRVGAHSTSGRGLLARDSVVRGVLELCGLADRAGRLAGSLTLLDLKRLEIARALALEPHLLLLDEVAAGLVGREVDEVIALVRRVQSRGTTIIMVEHVQTLIQSLAERVIVLDWGRKIAEGTPAEVAKDPNVMAVYLGSQGQVDSGPSPRPAHAEARETVLRAEGISVDYGKLRALRAVDLEVRRGEVVAVLGANGAGKSTLARALAGLVPLSAGRVYLGGADVTRQPAHVRARGGIALCHEGRRLFGDLTVAENLELGAAYASPGGRDGTVAERFERVYSVFPEVREKARVRAGLLSGGQQQMVAIARALVAEPRVLIFDELSLGLAPQVIDRIYPTLDQVRDWGIGVVLIEQNVHRALACADRVYLMERGEVTYSGTPEDLEQHRTELLHAAYFGQGSRELPTAEPLKGDVDEDLDGDTEQLAAS
jgi:branched-chain amino acid transport system ATP-binding protein